MSTETRSYRVKTVAMAAAGVAAVSGVVAMAARAFGWRWKPDTVSDGGAHPKAEPDLAQWEWEGGAVI
jgi:hypothetical protein